MSRPALLFAFALLSCDPALAQAPQTSQLAPASLPSLLPVPSSPEPSPREDLVTFDPRTGEVVWKDHCWQLVASGYLLKDFGRRESEARQALHLIQELGLNQRGTVGHPYPVMEYWLAEGRGPTGLTSGLRRLPLDAASLRVERLQTQWCVRDDHRILFHFGPYEDESRRALAILRKYRFTQLAFVGQAIPSMFVFLSEAGELGETSRSLTPVRMHTMARNPVPATGKRIPQGEEAVGSLAPATLPPLRAPEAMAHATPRAPSDHARAHAVMQPSLPGWDEQSDVVPLDGRNIQLRQEKGIWSLAAGGYVLACFGADEAAANQALQVVRHYHFTEHCRVGRPVPVFSYFLVNGQAPRGLMFGLGGQAFQPGLLSVQPLGRQWALCEGDRVLVVLGQNAADAHQLLAAIVHNKFDRLCHVGSDQEGMTFLVRVH